MIPKKYALVVVALVAAVLVFTALNEDDTSGNTSGSTDTTQIDPWLETISNMTSCEQLQSAFDTAGNGHDNADKLIAKEMFTDRMRAADDRMREIGCYG